MTALGSGRARCSSLCAALAVLAGCGEAETERAAQEPPPSGDPGPVHVHGLGVNPRDGALFIATHTGLFRAPAGDAKARRVGDRLQDTMGFTVVGPDRFLGSGHPDGRDRLPPFLGLIESSDGGRTWKPRSLLGRSDFHVLEAAGESVYGFGTDWKTRRQQFLVSDDGGRSWTRRRAPEPFVSLTVKPGEARRLVASGERALYDSADGGAKWRRRAGAPGLVAWREGGGLSLLDANGEAWAAEGGSLQRVGSAGGRPAALAAEGGDLYVALHDGTVKVSRDAGRSWSVRSQP